MATGLSAGITSPRPPARPLLLGFLLSRRPALIWFGKWKRKSSVRDSVDRSADSSATANSRRRSAFGDVVQSALSKCNRKERLRCGGLVAGRASGLYEIPNQKNSIVILYKNYGVSDLTGSKCRECLFVCLFCYYPRRSRSAIGVDIVFTLDVCMFVCLYVC